MAALHTGQWIKFFQQAGIPEKAAATYALTFAENRIQMNMLLDLNKEYLRDMGITLMGDVIAILRHARTKHEEIAREKLLVTSDREKTVVSSKAVEVVSVQVPNNAGPAKKASTVSRILDHYTREGVAVAPAIKSKPKPPSRDITDSAHLRKMTVNQPVAVPVKRKDKPMLRSDEPIIIDETPAKKVRRVSPEEEGGYKIKMPSGSTPRSQQILAKSKELARRQTVFQRLGKGSSSSSTSGTRSPPSAPAVSSTTGANTPSFRITGLLGGVRENPKTGDSAGFAVRSQSSSVFRRLGDKQVSSSTSTVVRREEPLPYAGILKAPDKFAKRIVTQRNKQTETVTMVADSVATSRTEIRERLGSALKALSELPEKTERTKTVSESSRGGVRARLGGTKLVSASSEREPSVKGILKMPSSKSISRIATPYSSAFSSEKEKSTVKKSGVFSRLGM